jgi:hypothetical protein
MEAAAHGGLRGTGPSASVAQDFLSKTPEKTKSSFAKEKRFTSAMRKVKSR